MSDGCPDLEALLDVRAGTADAAVVAHVESCAACRARLEELTALDDFAVEVRGVAQSSQRATPTSADARLDVPGYELLHEIHRGGQGVVYAARHRATDRPVALKVLLGGGRATARNRARFEREIDLAARIRHPNVIAVLDRVTTTTGREVLVMELAEGEPLDRYLADAAPSIDDRLALFGEICAGVTAAHQRGVLHRDLKPANIIVCPPARPKLVDFGLAKLEDDQARHGLHTQTGEFAGTLAYAAPEQVRGRVDAIDVRTDVYALGVVLYEMLTGAPPFDAGSSLDDAVRAVLEDDPQRASRAVRGLDADADAIIHRAMAKDPARRYPSVAMLAEDIRRLRAHEPVEAREPSALYQVGKFARRHRALVALAAVAGAALVAISIVSTLAYLRTAAAVDRRDAVALFFRSLMSEVEPGQGGPDMRVTELLDVAATRVASEFEPYPDLRGEIESTLGETYARLGAPDRAGPLLEDAVVRLRDVPAARRDELPTALNLLANVRVGAGAFEDAAMLLGEADGLARAPRLRSQLAQTRGALAIAEGAFEDAVARFDASIELLDGDGTIEADRLRVQARISQGVALNRLERFEDALATYDTALAILERVRDPLHPDVLACENNRAEVLGRLGRTEEARAIHRVLLDKRRTVFGPQHERVGITLNTLADLAREAGEFEEAERCFAEAIAIFERTPGDPNLRLATTRHNLGVLLLDRERFAQALDPLRAAADAAEARLTASHWIAAQFRVREAECVLRLGRADDALAMLGPARDVLAGQLGEEHRRVVFVDGLIGECGVGE